MRTHPEILAFRFGFHSRVTFNISLNVSTLVVIAAVLCGIFAMAVFAVITYLLGEQSPSETTALTSTDGFAHCSGVTRKEANPKH